MATGDVTRDAVLQAMREYGELGPDGFYQRYRYRNARDYVIAYEGADYPSKGIYGVAYDKLHPDEPPLRESGFSGGLGRVVPELRALGFEIKNKAESREGESEVAVAGAVTSPLHLLIRWSLAHEPRTVDIAREVADQQ